MQTLAVPIRVLPIPPIARPDELPITVETNDELAPTNPFLEKREVSELETSWHHLKVGCEHAQQQLLKTSIYYIPECYSTESPQVLQNFQ